MKQLSLFIYSLISIILFSVTSCKKERVYPHIDIQSPKEGSSYTFGDTIYVTANVENATSNIAINVLKGNQKMALPTELYSSDGNTYTWRIFFNNKYLLSDNYDVRVSALNGENSSSDFVEIRLTELSKSLKGLSILGFDGLNTKLYRIDSLAQISMIVLPDAYDFLINRSEFQQILVAPPLSGTLLAMKFKDLNSAFTVPDLSQGTFQYTQLYQFDRQSYSLLYDGRILGFGEEGTIISNFQLDDPFIPLAAESGDGDLAVLAKEGTLNQYRLFVLNAISGAVIKQVFIPGKVLGISYYKDSKFFILYQKNNVLRLAEYNAAGNVLTDRITINSEIGTDIILAGNLGYIGTNENLYSFNPESALFSSQVLNIPINQLEYDALNKDLYFSSNSTLHKMPPGSQQNQYVFAAADSIVDFDLMYNK